MRVVAPKLTLHDVLNAIAQVGFARLPEIASHLKRAESTLRAQLLRAENLELVISHRVNSQKPTVVLWKLTPLGQAYLKDNEP